MHVYVGYILIFLTFGFTVFCIIKNYEKLLLIISFCTIMVVVGLFIITQRRVTKLEFPGIGVIELTVGEETAFNEIIKSLKTQVANDTLKLSQLKAKLDSMFTFGHEGIKLKKELGVGNLQMTEDGGLMTLVDMNVTSIPSEGTVEGYAFKIDANSIMIVKAESDGKGGTKDRKVEFKGNLDILDSENGVILTSSNGSRWLLKVKNSGELDITKL